MKLTNNLKSLSITRMIALFILVFTLVPASSYAASSGSGGSKAGTQDQANEGSLPWTEKRYQKAHTGHYKKLMDEIMQWTRKMDEGSSSGGSGTGISSLGSSGKSGSGSGQKRARQLKEGGQITIAPAQIWPEVVPSLTYNTPVLRDQRDYDIDYIDFQAAKGLPVSDAEYYLLAWKKDNERLEKEFAPQQYLHLAEAMTDMTMANASNSANAVAANQTRSAIDVVRWSIINFTADPTSPFQLLRSQLFLPMAWLLLLVGAVAAQGRAIVAQGSPILGEISPFEGLTRSVVATFLIPGSFLVINYGIDVANSITFTISDEYTRLFQSDMYEDAQAAEAKALPVNKMEENRNFIPPEDEVQAQPGQGGKSPSAIFEQETVNNVTYDEEEGKREVKYSDEEMPQNMDANRMAMGAANAGLGMTWNILCAFQMAYLYYLWCMGPIAAALWVWPMERLRAAFPSWVEGVVTLCFWSLFWNTVVLLMACFRGVDTTGTVIMTALNGMATLCVQYAFDFSSLVSQGAASQLAGAVSQAMKGASGGAQQGAGGRGGAANRPAMGAMAANPGGRGGLGTGGMNPGYAALGGPSGASETVAFNNATTVPTGSTRGLPNFTGSNGGLMPVSYTGPTNTDGGVPLMPFTPLPGGGMPVADFSGGNPLTTASILASARSGDVSNTIADGLAELGAPASDRALAPWLAGLANSGNGDPNNPSAGSMLADYLHTHPNDPSAAGFANWLAQQDQLQGTVLGDALNPNNPHLDTNSQAALAQYLAEHPDMSVNDPALAAFLQNHPGGFNLDQMNNSPELQNLNNPNYVAFEGGPPLQGSDLTSFTYDTNGNLIPPTGGFPQDLTANANVDLKNLGYFDASGNRYELDANGNPFLVQSTANPQLDPLTNLPLHGLNGTDLNQGVTNGFNPDTPVLARDLTTGDVLATYHPHDGWIGENSGGRVHFDPVTQTGHVEGINGTFNYNSETNSWGMTAIDNNGTPFTAVSIEPNGGLNVSGTNFPVEQVTMPGGSSALQADLGNGYRLNSFDGGATWVTPTDAATYVNSGGTVMPTNTFEVNHDSGGFTTVGSQGSSLVYDSHGLHLANSPLPVVESSEGPRYTTTDNYGGMRFSNDGVHWTTDATTTAATTYSYWDGNNNVFTQTAPTELLATSAAGPTMPYNTTVHTGDVVTPYGTVQTGDVTAYNTVHPGDGTGYTTIHPGDTTYGTVLPGPDHPPATIAYDSESRPLSPFVPESSPTVPFLSRDTEVTNPVVGNYYVGSDSSFNHYVVPGTSLTASYDTSTGSWPVDNTHGQVVVNNSDGSMTVAGTNASVMYEPDSQTLYSYAAHSDNPVVLTDGRWEMQTPAGPIPVTYDHRFNDWVPENAGIVAPTAEYASPAVLPDQHQLPQPDPYTFAGTHVEGGAGWDTVAIPADPHNIAYEDHPIVTPHPTIDNPTVAGLFVGERRQDALPPPEAPFQPAAGAISGAVAGSIIGPMAARGKLNSIVAGMQPTVGSGPAKPPEVAHTEDLQTQLMRANRRGGRQMTKAQLIELLRQSGYEVNDIDDNGNIIA